MSNISAVMTRIQEIQNRISALSPPQVPALTPEAAKLNAQNPTAHSPSLTPNKPFDVMLAKVGGNVSFRPIGGAAFTPSIDGLVEKYAQQNGLEPNVVKALIQQESSGNPRAVSAVGAQGLMQLMPQTARAYGVTDPFDAEQNISAGTRHFAGLMREFGGDLSQALAAYNAGSAAVKKYNGVPPFAETQTYVRRIMQNIGR